MDNTLAAFITGFFWILFGLVAGIVFVPKKIIEQRFAKSLERYKAEYQKNIQNFGLYRTKKHEVYHHIINYFYSSGLGTRWLKKYIYDTISTFEQFTDDEIKDNVISKIKELTIVQKDIDWLFELRAKDNEKFIKEILRWRHVGNNNILRKAYIEFHDYIFANQLYIKKEIFNSLEEVLWDLHKLLVAYESKEQWLFERTRKDFFEERDKYSKAILDKMQWVINNIRNDIEDYSM